VVVELGEIVGHGVDDGLVEPFQLRGCLERGDVEGELLRAVEKEFDAAQARVFGAELETPFYGWLGWRAAGCGCVGGREVIGYLCRYLVGGDAIAARPGLYYLNIIWGTRVDGSDPDP
jgi:hypothetical protein